MRCGGAGSSCRLLCGHWCGERKIRQGYISGEANRTGPIRIRQGQPPAGPGSLALPGGESFLSAINRARCQIGCRLEHPHRRPTTQRRPAGTVCLIIGAWHEHLSPSFPFAFLVGASARRRSRICLRGRVTGSLDVLRRGRCGRPAAAAGRFGVPGGAADSALCRRRVAVARELAQRFGDGLAAGSTPEQLIESFGSIKQTARSMCRDRLHARPLVWRVSAPLLASGRTDGFGTGRHLRVFSCPAAHCPSDNFAQLSRRRDGAD